MKVGFLMPPTIAGRQNGVVMQAITWKEALEGQGVVVDLLSPWMTYEWNSYDAVHAFGLGHYVDIFPLLKKQGVKSIVFSPIYDSNRSSLVMNLASRASSKSLGIKNIWSAFRSNLDQIDTVLARSDFEEQKLISVFGVPRSKIAVCRLPARFSKSENEQQPDREAICVHVSILSASIKNVPTLIRAAEKYGFTLHLAGRVTDAEFKAWLDDVVERNDNVKYLGVLSDNELRNLYRRARVFALPSLMEGVGLVGIEAALHGADVLMTNRGGPKEYYAGMAQLVDPEDIDEIGRSVLDFLGGRTYQPKLSRHIEANYSMEASARELIHVYKGRTNASCLR